MILNQVTSTAPSTPAGPLEVFGSPAFVIISNPNGSAVNGLSLTNAPNLVLTMGAPQFITGPGGTPASFANAGALAYQVSSGAAGTTYKRFPTTIRRVRGSSLKKTEIDITSGEHGLPLVSSRS
ncbi:filamentous hemagglutinin N-terminal domain-containing protein [Trinickia violacea]|nr:filamentous hemagglutinin N-terminal domain-containing protein [Trinickia violacea]QCP55090.1 filamentous hemagglutinin N-terminal domain-containing protein [Trinickia violacea]